MSNEMMDALQALAGDRGISVDRLFGILANALESAYKRMPDAQEYAWVTIDPDTFEIRVLAQELDEEGEPTGPELDVTPQNFGRIAAQTAKQVMMQRIREAEREMKYEEYAGREGDIVTGIIQQNDARYTLLDLGRVEALLPQAHVRATGLAVLPSLTEVSRASLLCGELTTRLTPHTIAYDPDDTRVTFHDRVAILIEISLAPCISDSRR